MKKTIRRSERNQQITTIADTPGTSMPVSVPFSNNIEPSFISSGAIPSRNYVSSVSLNYGGADGGNGFLNSLQSDIRISEERDIPLTSSLINQDQPIVHRLRNILADIHFRCRSIHDSDTQELTKYQNNIKYLTIAIDVILASTTLPLIYSFSEKQSPTPFLTTVYIPGLLVITILSILILLKIRRANTIINKIREHTMHMSHSSDNNGG